MKKFIFSILSVIMAFSMFTTTSYADSAGWQLIDTYTLVNGKLSYLNGAEGGNAKICLTDDPGGSQVVVYDNDGGSLANSEIIIPIHFWSDGECHSFDVDAYVDGSDNDAEFIFRQTRDSFGEVIVQLWD